MHTFLDPTSPEDPEGLNHVQIGPGIMGPWPGQMMMNDPNMMMNMSQYGQVSNVFNPYSTEFFF